MKASCTPCEKSATVSFSGNRVAVMRLRISSSSASAASKRNGRIAVLSVVCSVRGSATVAGVMLTSFLEHMKPDARLAIYQTKVSTIRSYQSAATFQRFGPWSHGDGLLCADTLDGATRHRARLAVWVRVRTGRIPAHAETERRGFRPMGSQHAARWKGVATRRGGIRADAGPDAACDLWQGVSSAQLDGVFPGYRRRPADQSLSS